MRKMLVLWAIMATTLAGCKKYKDDFSYGTVLEKGGCYNESWLVRVENGIPARDFFLCAQIIELPGNNCNNSVFISLPANLAVAGKRIKFKPKAVEPSCFSYNLAPKHITVKTISAVD